MSFDIFLIGLAEGKGGDLAREPIRAMLQHHRLESLGEDSYNVCFEDGSHVEFSATGLNSGKEFGCCAFYIINMSDAIVRFVFEVAKAGRGVLFPTMEHNPCILVSSDLRLGLPPDLGLPIVECPSPETLVRFLGGGYREWSAYRDYVIENHASTRSKT